MLYQLPNGKCIEISTEQFLRMSDEELEMYMAYNIGEEVNDPFALSVLRHGPGAEVIEDDSELYPELSTEDEEYIEDLVDIMPEEKLYDGDFIDTDNIEQ